MVNQPANDNLFDRDAKALIDTIFAPTFACPRRSLAYPMAALSMGALMLPWLPLAMLMMAFQRGVR